MARGDQTAFDSVSEATGETVHDFTPSTGDSLKVALVSDAITAIVAQTNLADFTEVVGSGYTAGGENTTITAWTRSGATTQLNVTDVGWLQDAAGPTDIKTAILYNSSKLGQDDAITYIDLTEDGGVTPVSLQVGALNIDLSTNPPLFSTRR